MRVVELLAAVLCLLIGVRAMLDPTRLEDDLEGWERLLVAVHDASRAGFWFALSGLFLGFALIDDAASFRWFALIPIGMAALRMLAAVRLSRR